MGDGSSSERLDQLAAQQYDNPSLWRLLAVANNIDNPAQIPAGIGIASAADIDFEPRGHAMSSLVTLPHLVLEVDGAALGEEALQGLVQVRVQQRLSAPTLCELYFHAGVGPLDAVESLVPGTSIWMRLVNEPTPLFVGQVTAIETIYGPVGQQELCIRGYDALHAMRQRQSVQVHRDVTVADLARKLAGGMGVQATESGPRWSMLFQHRQNDLELLVETAAYSGLYLTVRDQQLHLITLAGQGTPQPLTLGESLLEAPL